MIGTVWLCVEACSLVSACPGVTVVLAQRLRLLPRPRSPWYSGPGHVGWAQQTPGAWVFPFAGLTWTFWCLWLASMQ